MMETRRHTATLAAACETVPGACVLIMEHGLLWSRLLPENAVFLMLDRIGLVFSHSFTPLGTEDLPKIATQQPETFAAGLRTLTSGGTRQEISRSGVHQNPDPSRAKNKP